MIEKRKVHTKPTPQYRRGYGDYDILHMASKGKGGRGISSDKMKSMAKWIEINQEIDEAHDEIKRIENIIPAAKTIKSKLGLSSYLSNTFFSFKKSSTKSKDVKRSVAFFFALL